MRAMCFALLAVLVVASVSMAATPPDLSVLPAEFRGIVLYPDGKTPVEGLPVRVWDAQAEKIVYRTQTDDNGVFAIPEMTEGDHYVLVGSVRIDMRLLTARAGIVPQPHGLVVVVPRVLPIAPILIPTTVAGAALPRIMSP